MGTERVARRHPTDDEAGRPVMPAVPIRQIIGDACAQRYGVAAITIVDDLSLEAGWNSVLFDGSALDVAENTRQTIEVVAEAERHGIGRRSTRPSPRPGCPYGGQSRSTPSSSPLAAARADGIAADTRARRRPRAAADSDGQTPGSSTRRCAPAGRSPSPQLRRGALHLAAHGRRLAAHGRRLADPGQARPRAQPALRGPADVAIRVF